jgi:DNA-binding transcriptional MocR family regulator
MNEVAKNGGGELSEAEKLAIAEEFKAKLARGELADGRVVPIKRPVPKIVEMSRAAREAHHAEKRAREETEKKAAVVAELAQSAGAKLESKEAAVAIIKPKIDVPPRVEPATFDEKDLTRVPGVVGRLTDWMTASPFTQIGGSHLVGPW